MIKNVYELLSEIYKGNCDKLPNKIKVDDIIWEKDTYTRDYIAKELSPRQYLFEYLFKRDTMNALNLEVEKVREDHWKPKYKEEYYYIDTLKRICEGSWENDETDYYRYYTNNCFKIREEAKKHLENIKTEIKLRKLADELNNDEKIDWRNEKQNKYYLYYNHQYEEIDFSWELIAEQSHEIYCLDEDFKEKAIEKIGREKLINYLTQE